MNEDEHHGAPLRRRESHLMSAEMTDPELIRVVLSGLPVATAISTPPGLVAVTRQAVTDAGLDTLAVSRWLQPFGGFGAVAYLRPASDRLSNQPYRPALHPVSYFAVPVEALRAPTEEQEPAAGVGIRAGQRSASG